MLMLMILSDARRNLVAQHIGFSDTSWCFKSSSHQKIVYFTARTCFS